MTQKLTGLALLRYGFVHVTGLPIRRGSEDSERDRIEPSTADCGHYDHNNGMSVVITTDGEVYIRRSSGNKVDSLQEYRDLVMTLCPKGLGAFVPCSNGDAIPSHMILARVSDPYWIGTNGEYQFKVPANQIESARDHAERVIVGQPS